MVKIKRSGPVQNVFQDRAKEPLAERYCAWELALQAFIEQELLSYVRDIGDPKKREPLFQGKISQFLPALLFFCHGIPFYWGLQDLSTKVDSSQRLRYING